jgi:Flp pilus assembly protein protease CpaA
MNSILHTSTNFRSAQDTLAAGKSNRWIAALALPLVAGPIWCRAWGPDTGQLGTLSGLVLVAVLATSAITDLNKHKIYNWATYSAILWALAINALGSPTLGSVGIAQCLGGAALCFLITLFGYDMSGGGAGDVKLATAIGALLGIEHGVFAVGYSYVVAGIAIISWTTWINGPLTLLKAGARTLGGLLGPLWPFQPTGEDRKLLTRPVPLGPYFATGTMLVVLELVPTWHNNF